MNHRKSLSASAVSMLVLMTACTAPATRPDPPAGTSVPMLRIVADCGDCDLQADMIDEIEQAYRAAALDARIAIDTSAEAKLVVTAFEFRSMLFMMAAGPLAISRTDSLTGHIAKGQERVAVDYSSRTPIPFGRTGSMSRAISRSALDVIRR